MEKKPAAAMVVVYTSKDAKFIHQGKTASLGVGDLVQKGDTIRTGNGGVDLQGADGALVRIREYTTLSVSDISGRPGEGRTELHLDSGSLLAKVQRESSKSQFEVSTPTAIASVRGTAFTVEVNEGESPKVRVLKGAVALAPRPEILKEFSEKEIQASPELQKLFESLKGREVVLESETEGTLTPDVNDIVVMLNERIVPGTESTTIQKSVESASQSLDKIGKDASIQQAKSRMSEKETAELETLSGVDKKLVDRALTEGDQNDTAQKQDTAEKENIQKSILTDYDTNVNQALVRIEKNAESKGIKSDEDIRRYYSVLEEVVLTNGTVEKGAIVAQIGDKLILHSAKGVQQVDKKDINYIDYHNFDIKEQSPPRALR